MKETALIFIILLLLSCNQKVANSHIYGDKKLFKFSLKTVTSDYEKNELFTVLLPRNGKRKKAYPHFGEIYLEYRILYEDSSVFYISNDIWNGSQLNRSNLYNAGITGYTKKNILDTLTYHGLQKDGRYWKETFWGEVVLGYSSVPPSRKVVFDNAVSSIRKLE